MGGLRGLGGLGKLANWKIDKLTNRLIGKLTNWQIDKLSLSLPNETHYTKIS